MKIDFAGLVATLLEQVANLTRDEQRTFAQQLGAAVATFAKSSKTSLEMSPCAASPCPSARTSSMR
ncbi:MAG: hypothetical protein GC155_11700 [Alphaproteobacteria bacterium]|nr:hypothetical protein [Alphaproteobacteria bacterium]